jgi:anti-anti-sigma regulatory factor
MARQQTRVSISRPSAVVDNVLIQIADSQRVVCCTPDSLVWPSRCSELPAGLTTVLKITTKEHPESFTLVLEGRLCRPWLGEVEDRWSELISSAAEKQLLVDLAGVTFIDQDGEKLLASILERGAAVRASGVLVRYMVQQAQQQIARDARRASRSTPKPRRGPGVP